MKAKLIFDLDLPDERMAHLRAIKSTNMAIAMFDFDQKLKTYINGSTKERETTILESIKKEFTEILQYNNINLDELLT